jgi:hypothetical protein
MRTFIFAVAVVATATTFVGCSSGSGNPPRNPGAIGQPLPSSSGTFQPADLTGTWDGEFTAAGLAPTAITFDFQQSGGTLAGTYSAANGASGTILGTVVGHAFTLDMASSVASCGGAYSGTGIAIADAITFRFSGADCSGTYADVSGGATRVGTGTATSTTTAGGLGSGVATGVLTTLAFGVIDAEYSDALDRIVIASASPSAALHIYDPLSKTAQSVTLAAAPTALSVSPDGRFAAVGHNKKISYISLAAPSVVKVVTCTANVGDIVLGQNAFAYLVPQGSSSSYYSTAGPLATVNLTTGYEILGSTSFSNGAKLKLHPSGTSFYTTGGDGYYVYDKYEILAGLGVPILGWSGPQNSYSYYGGEDFWLSRDGNRIFQKSGAVLRSSTVQSEDMTAAGQISLLGKHIRDLAHSSVSGKLALIPDQAQTSSYYSSSTSTNVSEDTQIDLYDATMLGFERSHRLPAFEVGGRIFAAHGRFIFFDRAGRRVTVIVRADPAAALPKEWGVVQY